MVCASISLYYGDSSWSGDIIRTFKGPSKSRQMDMAYIGLTAIGRQDKISVAMDIFE